MCMCLCGVLKSYKHLQPDRDVQEERSRAALRASCVMKRSPFPLCDFSTTRLLGPVGPGLPRSVPPAPTKSKKSPWLARGRGDLGNRFAKPIVDSLLPFILPGPCQSQTGMNHTKEEITVSRALLGAATMTSLLS